MSGRPWVAFALTPRDPNEPHRASTPLELLFDLVFVVAVSLSSQALHHLESEGHLGQGIGAYLAVFFAIWWAWMNFTWFATSFDPDDWLYRIATFVQMGGALVIAAGIGPGVATGNITWIVVGYLIMRLVSIPQWVRVAVHLPEYRQTATRYAAGIAVVQALWIAVLITRVYEFGLWTLLPLMALELCVPAYAERAKPTPWHPHHIAERFSLFTLILLGESILAASNAVIQALGETIDAAPLVILAVIALAIVAGMWWVYFSRPMHGQLLGGLRRAMTFGYAHFLIFASAGAFSAGIEVAVDLLEGDTVLSDVAARATLAVPVAVFFFGVWWLALRSALSAAANAGVLTLIATMVGSVSVPASALVVALAGVAIVLVIEKAPAPTEEAATA